MASVASANSSANQNTRRVVPAYPGAAKANGAPSIAGSLDGAAATAKDDPVQAIQKLEKKLKAINTNNIARVANSHIETDTESIKPLVSLKNGRNIDKMPTTVKELMRLKVTTIDTMLTHLEADRSGTEKDKQARLKMQFGIGGRLA